MKKVQYKKCSRCKADKPHGQFGKHSKRKDGLQTVCKECAAKNLHEWWFEKGGKETSQTSSRRRKTQKKDRERWHFGKKRDAYYIRKYGITLDDYNRILTEQDGLCALCGFKPVRTNFNLAVDHDHKTGRVRGLLCRRCNVTLAAWGDDLDSIIEKLTDYFGKEIPQHWP